MILRSNTTKSAKALTTKRRVPNRRKSPVRSHKHQHLCEVKARAHKARAHRNRWIFGIVARLTLIAFVLGGSIYGIWRGVDYLFLSNEEFSLTELSIETDGNMSREEIIHASRVELGANIFKLSLANIRADLELLPQVERAEVSRGMPNRLSIRVVERTPVAWVLHREPEGDPFTIPGAFLVDARGVLMSADRLLPEYLRLPIITGIETAHQMAGNAVDSAPLRAALQLIIATNSALDQHALQVRAIDLSKRYCMVVTDSNKAKITMALERLPEQLERWETLSTHVNERGLDIATANLMLQRDIPVTFLLAYAEDPAAAAELDPDMPMDLPVRRAIPVR